MTSGSRAKAKAIFEAGLAAADPYRLLKSGFRDVAGRGWRYREETELPFPGDGGRVRIFGAGKAAGSLARALEEVLRAHAPEGRVIVKHGHGVKLDNVIVEEGGHPLPDESGLAATRQLLRDLSHGRAQDRIFWVLTGGASSLLVAPAEGIWLADKIATTDLLLRSGASIGELNAVRKHLSAVKGGRLLERTAPATVYAFVVSDVIGDDLSSIGSGPAVADPTTFLDCLEIVEKYGLAGRLPASVRSRLEEGARGRVPETPKPGDPLLESARHVVLASNRHALAAAAEEASALGLRVEIFGRDLEGDVHGVAEEFAARLLALDGPAALLAGGELTLEVRGSGLGGRNQEFALVAARRLRGRRGVVVLAAGTDGTDGPTDAAGAFADGTSWDRATEGGIDPAAALADNDSYRLFDSLGDLLRTGPTGTNVNDVLIGIRDEESSPDRLR